MSDSQKLHPDFDLLYDVKTMADVETIAKGEAHCSDADPEELATLFKDLKLPLPDCLSEFKGYTTIWVCNDGSWSTIEPLCEEAYKYRKTKISSF